MFGEKHRPPKPPPYESWLVLLMAVGIALLVTGVYVGIHYLSQRSVLP